MVSSGRNSSLTPAAVTTRAHTCSRGARTTLDRRTTVYPFAPGPGPNASAMSAWYSAAVSPEYRSQSADRR